MAQDDDSDDAQAGGTPKEPIPFGKYLILGRIRKGGMATVFLARPRGQKRPVAIKVIRKSLANRKQYVEMFVREGKLAVLLNHDAIVKTYEIGKIQGRHFICMEYILGVDLSTLLQKFRADAARRLPLPHVLHIAARMCDGLHYAHDLTDVSGKLLNVVNRDVSPSNIRVTFEGEVKLLDFGIAKATSSLSSEIGVLKGKFRHMSPEQVRGLPLDRRSDVFSVGISLYEMLTLERLFKADSTFQMMDLVRKAEVPRPSSINPRVPPAVDEIVLKALQKNPAERYQTAQEMGNALREALSGYHFARSELRDLVREVCRDEWARGKESLEACLSSRQPTAETVQPEDENYGEFFEVTALNADLEEAAEPQSLPAWIIVLLIVTLLLLGLALFLLFWLKKN